MTALDWRGHRVNAVAKPCRICTLPALMTDAAGRPCHKTCGEQQGDRDGERYGRGGGR